MLSVENEEPMFLLPFICCYTVLNLCSVEVCICLVVFRQSTIAIKSLTEPKHNEFHSFKRILCFMTTYMVVIKGFLRFDKCTHINRELIDLGKREWSKQQKQKCQRYKHTRICVLFKRKDQFSIQRYNSWIPLNYGYWISEEDATSKTKQNKTRSYNESTLYTM